MITKDQDMELFKATLASTPEGRAYTVAWVDMIRKMKRVLMLSKHRAVYPLQDIYAARLAYIKASERTGALLERLEKRYGWPAS